MTFLSIAAFAILVPPAYFFDNPHNKDAIIYELRQGTTPDEVDMFGIAVHNVHACWAGADECFESEYDTDLAYMLSLMTATEEVPAHRR